ncbi:hypothetical protein WJX73_007036 [Symbiochloris irregularis]|uniref:Srp40 C-terminal domain-containing protein n=1 Tax=Symbiochloris irregularis TaxID=706552 RepID=A0AAW1PZ57_9CHLO
MSRHETPSIPSLHLNHQHICELFLRCKQSSETADKKKKKKKSKQEAAVTALENGVPKAAEQATGAIAVEPSELDPLPEYLPPPPEGGAQAGRSASAGRAGLAGRTFQRVDAQEWLGQKGSWDNSYAATFGSDGWGAKAQERLGQVRGKDFRHEKTKKKRGSYRGGSIDGAVRSFKYDSD